MMTLAPTIVVAAFLFGAAFGWCPEDWTLSPGVGCYLTSDASVHFDEAREICGRLGASLLSINDEEEREKIEEIMSNDWGHYWVGAEYNKSLTDFLWDDGTRVRKDWVKGLPTASSSNQATGSRKRHSRSCVVFRSIMKFPHDPITNDKHLLDFQLHTTSCDVSWRYICEKTNVTTTTMEPTTTMPPTTPPPPLQPSSMPACQPKTVTVTVTETMVSSVFVKQIQGPPPAIPGFDFKEENKTKDVSPPKKEFPSKFSEREKSVRMVISKSLGTMAIMIVVIVLVGICLLDIPCERFCGDDKKSRGGGGSWLCGCGGCKKKASRRCSTTSGVVTTLTAPQRPSQRFAASTDANGTVLGMVSGGGFNVNNHNSSLSRSLGDAEEEEGAGLNTTNESVVQPITPAKVAMQQQQHSRNPGVNLMGMTTPVRHRNTGALAGYVTGSGSPSVPFTSTPNRYVSSIPLPTPVVGHNRQASPSLLDTEIRKRQLRSGLPSFKPGADATGAGLAAANDVPSTNAASSPAFAQQSEFHDSIDNPLDSLPPRETHDRQALDFPVLEPTRPTIK